MHNSTFFLRICCNSEWHGSPSGCSHSRLSSGQPRAFSFFRETYLLGDLSYKLVVRRSHSEENFDRSFSYSDSEDYMFSFVDVVSLATTSSTSTQYTPTFPGGILLAWLICNGAKRNPIGGWLLFFYWQLYAGILMTAFFFAMNIQSYIPENFAISIAQANIFFSWLALYQTFSCILSCLPLGLCCW